MRPACPGFRGEERQGHREGGVMEAVHDAEGAVGAEGAENAEDAHECGLHRVGLASAHPLAGVVRLGRASSVS